MITQGDIYRMMAGFADDPSKLQNLLSEMEQARQTVAEWAEEAINDEVGLSNLRSEDILNNIRLVVSNLLASMCRDAGISQVSLQTVNTLNAILYLLHLLAYKVEERTKREVLAELVFESGENYNNEKE